VASLLISRGQHVPGTPGSRASIMHYWHPRNLSIPVNEIFLHLASWTERLRRSWSEPRGGRRL